MTSYFKDMTSQIIFKKCRKSRDHFEHVIGWYDINFVKNQRSRSYVYRNEKKTLNFKANFS